MSKSFLQGFEGGLLKLKQLDKDFSQKIKIAELELKLMKIELI